MAVDAGGLPIYADAVVEADAGDIVQKTHALLVEEKETKTYQRTDAAVWTELYDA